MLFIELYVGALLSFWQFIPLIDNNIIIVCARHTDNIYLAIIVGPKQNTVHVCMQCHYQYVNCQNNYYSLSLE